MESLPFLDFRLAPLDLAHCAQAWQQHVLEMRGVRNIFTPQIGLDAEYVLLLPFVEPLERIVAVDLLDSQGTVAERLALRRLDLVEVAVLDRSHDDVETHSGRLFSSCRPSPRHHCRTLLEFAFEDLIPADDLVAVLLQESLHP